MKMLQAKDRQSNRNKDAELVDSIKSKLLVLKQMIRWCVIYYYFLIINGLWAPINYYILNIIYNSFNE